MPRNGGKRAGSDTSHTENGGTTYDNSHQEEEKKPLDTSRNNQNDPSISLDVSCDDLKFRPGGTHHRSSSRDRGPKPRQEQRNGMDEGEERMSWRPRSRERSVGKRRGDRGSPSRKGGQGRRPADLEGSPPAEKRRYEERRGREPSNNYGVERGQHTHLESSRRRSNSRGRDKKPAGLERKARKLSPSYREKAGGWLEPERRRSTERNRNDRPPARRWSREASPMSLSGYNNKRRRSKSPADNARDNNRQQHQQRFNEDSRSRKRYEPDRHKGRRDQDSPLHMHRGHRESSQGRREDESRRSAAYPFNGANDNKDRGNYGGGSSRRHDTRSRNSPLRNKACSPPAPSWRSTNGRRSGTCWKEYELRREGYEVENSRRGGAPRAGTSLDMRRGQDHRGERDFDSRLNPGGREERYRERSRNYNKRGRSRSLRSSKRQRKESPVHSSRDDLRTRDEGRHRARDDLGPKVQDDEEGHLIFNPGMIIYDRYKIHEELGEGTFGKVVKCLDIKKDKVLAIKIIRNIKKYREAAHLEINVLNKLAKYDPSGRNHCVQMYDSFDFHGHKCIVFELLGKSVFDFLKDNDYNPYPLEHVRQISYELCVAVDFIHQHRLTHTDLKPENILFYSSNYIKEARRKILNSPEIRLIDFGSATFDNEHHSSIIQTRHYRAPEVILKLGWNQSCDVWSVGCIIFELAVGFMLFDTHSSHEHLALMERVLGPFPTEMALKTSSSYFSKGKLIWEEGSKDDRQVRKKVEPLERYIPREQRGNQEWQNMFNLIRKMLEYQPQKRITLAEALDHPFLQRFGLRRINSRHEL